MSQSPPPSRVKGGPPWWLWGILSVTTIAVIAGLFLSSVPDDPQTLYVEVRDTVASGELDVVKDKIARLKQFDSHKWHAQLLEGMLAFREMRDPRAQKLLAEIPDDSEVKPEALKKLGDSYRRTYKYKDAIKAYDKVESLAPGSNPDASVSLAGLYIGVGAYSLAEKTLGMTIEQNPDFESAYQVRAMLRKTQRREADALVDFQQFLSTPGQFSAATPAVLGSYAETVVKLGKTELINQLAEEHLSLLEEPRHKMAVLIAAKKYDEVDDLVQGENSPASQMPTAKKMMALVEIEQQKWQEAEKSVTPSLQVMPRDIELFEMAARIYKALDDPARLAIVEQNLEQLRSIQDEISEGIKNVGDNIDDADLRIVVARSYLQLGDFESARRWYSVAAALNEEKYGQEAKDAFNGVGFPRTMLVEFPADSDSKSDDISTEDGTPEAAKADEAKVDADESGESASEEAKADETNASDENGEVVPDKE